MTSPSVTHTGLEILEKLRKSGVVDERTLNDLSLKFSKLNNAFQESCRNEDMLLRRSQELDRELKAQKAMIESTASQQQNHRSQLSDLRQLVANTESELERTEEETKRTTANTKLKAVELEKLQEKVTKAEDELRTKHEPQRQQIQREISDLEKVLEEKKEKTQVLMKH